MNQLLRFMRKQQRLFGYEEVVSPIIYKKSLWERSGHWEQYKEDMFQVTGRAAKAEDEDSKEEYGIKPMNCPGHCLMFSALDRSYKNLPVRYSDFSPLHRYSL